MICVQEPKFLDGCVLMCGEGAAEHAEVVCGEGTGGVVWRKGPGGAVAVCRGNDVGDGGESGSNLCFDCRRGGGVFVEIGACEGGEGGGARGEER